MPNKRENLLPENLSLDILIFIISILLLLSLSLETFLLLILPLITFGYTIILKLGKSKLDQDYSKNIYPVFHKKILKKFGSRFTYITSILITFTYWLSLDSYVFPQLISTHAMFYVIIMGFLFSFAFSWIFAKIWKHYNFKDIFEGIDIMDISQEEHQTTLKQLDLLISTLQLGTIRKFYLINSLVFIAINVLNVVFAIFTFNNLLPGVTITLSGTGFEGSPPITLPYSYFIIIVVSPLIAIISLINLRKSVTQISKAAIKECINEMPKVIQTKLVENIDRVSNFYDEIL